MFAETELMKEIRGGFSHGGEDLFDNRLEEADLPISKTGSEESCDLNITGIAVPVRELYGVMQKSFPKIILLVKPVKCAPQP